MKANISFLIRLALIVAIPVLVQSIGRKYLANWARSVRIEGTDNDYALLRDGDGKPRIPRIPGLEQLHVEGLDPAAAHPKSKFNWTDESAALSESKSTRSAVLMRYIGPDVQPGKSGTTCVTEVPPGTAAMLIDGRLQVFHPPAKSNRDR